MTGALLDALLAPPPLLYAIRVFFVYARIGHKPHTIQGLIVAHTLVAIPFVVITMTAGFKSYDMSQEMVARSLGANRFTAFMTVTLPQIKLSVISSALLAFIVSFDEVILSIFLSAGEVATLTRVMFSTLRDDVDPTIAAVSSLLLIIATVPPLVLQLSTNRKKKEG